MSGKARPSLRAKTLLNVDYSNLSITDKKCIHEVFSRFENMNEVKKGKWLKQKLCGEDIVDCSECKTIGSPQWKWCPVCGAKMDGKDGAE